MIIGYNNNARVVSTKKMQKAFSQRFLIILVRFTNTLFLISTVFFFQPTNHVFYFKILIIAIKLFSRRGIENLDFNLVQWLGLLTYCIMQLLNVKVKMVKMHLNFLILYFFFHFNFYISQKIVICMVQLNLKDFDSFG